MFDAFFISLQCFFLSFGPLGLFIFAIIANASLILPIPIDAVLFFVARVDFFGWGIFTPFAMGLLIGLGSAIGEFSGYLLGLAGSKGYESLKKSDVSKLDAVKEKIANKGIPIIFLGALTPFPFDVIGVAAGLIRYDPKKFFVGAFLGKSVRYILIALAGYFVISSISAFFGLDATGFVC